MLLINNGANPLAHGEHRLFKGAKADIPQEIAEVWLEIPGVERYISPAELEKTAKEAKAKAEEEKQALIAEIEKLKAEKAELEKTAKEAKATTKKK